MIESIERFLDEWGRTVDGRTIDVVPEMMRLGLRIASRTLFSTDISGESDSIGGAYRTAFEYVSLKLNGRFLAPGGCRRRATGGFTRPRRCSTAWCSS